MPVTRFLGAAWAAIHAPHAGRALAVWVLEHGFGGVIPGPAARPMPWAELRQLGREMPFALGDAWRLANVAESDDRADRGLGSRNRGELAAARTAVQGAVDRARALGLRRVILEPGAVPLSGEPGPVDLADPRTGWTRERARAQAARRDRSADSALDVACRTLHGICKSNPDMEFCLIASRCVDGVGTAAGLAAIFEDLAGLRLGYWHEAAITACRGDRLGEPQGEWLERFASRLRGLTATDYADGSVHLPPGSGLVDYPLVANYVPHTSAADFAVAIELDPGVPPEELPGVHSYLDKFGL